MQEELRPCPACAGNETEILVSSSIVESQYVGVRCTDCRLVMYVLHRESNEQLIQRWNTRAESPELRAIQKAMKWLEEKDKSEQCEYENGIDCAVNVIRDEMEKEGVNLE